MEETGGSFCPFQGSSGITLLASQPEGLSVVGFCGPGLGGNTHAEGPEALLFCVTGPGSARSGWSVGEHFLDMNHPLFVYFLFFMLLLLLLVFLLYCYFQ